MLASTCTFAGAKGDEVAPELCKIAVGQLRATATFYREGFARAVGDNPEARNEGAKVAKAISELADNIEKLSQSATGSPRLGREYATTFRLGTGINGPVADVLKRATADLAAKRTEAANFGRKVWRELMNDKEPPADDAVLLRRLFERVAEDRDTNEETYASRWKTDVVEIEKFVRKKRIMTLPDPLTLVVEKAPAYFVGQSFGGVYPAGPYSPEAKTILFLPVPPGDATAKQREDFFRDFNRPFSRMIVPHELIPGHYVQLKYAAHHPHKVRAVFPDPVYVEGWGTFCERLLLDQGWGSALPRLAHLKKQLENIARTIVDIRVHTGNMSREEMDANVIGRFVRDHRTLLRRLMADAMNGEPLALEFAAANLPRHFGVILGLVVAGQRSGALKPVPPAQAVAFIAGAVGGPIVIGGAIVERDTVPAPLRETFNIIEPSDSAPT